MAYTAKTWSNGMVITAADLNKIERGVAAKAASGPAGKDGKNGVTPTITMTATKLAAGAAPTVTKGGTAEAPTFALGIPAGANGTNGKDGAAGVGVKAIALTTDATGKVTGGTVTFTDNKTAAITVTVAGA